MTKTKKIGLVDVDQTGFPNLALMKIASFYKVQGYEVDWCNAINQLEFDDIYASSVFSFNVGTDKTAWLPKRTITGGTGFHIRSELPGFIDCCDPDYSIYPDEIEHPIGFLTRGCTRTCPDCIVPQKEGNIHPYRNIEDIIRPNFKTAVLMDNNVLACDHGIRQIEKIIDLGIKVDFNQGLDARLIDDSIARLLSKMKYLEPLRLACDTPAMIEPVREAIELLRYHNTKPIQYSCYVMVKDVDTALKIVKFLKGMHVAPFLQNYVDRKGNSNPENIPLINWANRKQHYRACTFEDFKYCKSEKPKQTYESKSLWSEQ